MTRILGIDHGRRRIGVAVADEETAMAFARPALMVDGRPAAAVAAVARIARDEAAGLIVLGLPRNMDGSEGPQAARARTFGEQLVAAGLRVEYVDERLTSWDAGQRLADANRRPARTSGELDSAAARLILQDYLDARTPPRSRPAVDAGDDDDQESG